MEQVVSASDTAGNLSRDVLSGAAGIGSEAAKLRTEMDQFLAAVRKDTTDERRHYERIAANGIMVGIKAQGRPAARTELRNMSRGGAAIASDWTVSAGTELELELPNGGGTVTARVVRSGGGELAVVFGAEPQALARIDRALAALTQTRRGGPVRRQRSWKLSRRTTPRSKVIVLEQPAFAPSAPMSAWGKRCATLLHSYHGGEYFFARFPQSGLKPATSARLRPRCR